MAIWGSMISRCHNRNCPKYNYYGGRGILVCDEWRESFKSFYDAVGPRPGKGYELDRIDNNDGYRPGNVRWATKIANMRNKRSNRIIEHNGVSKPLVAWAETIGISATALATRIRKTPLDIGKALTTPVQKQKRHGPVILTYNGETMSATEWAKRFLLPPNIVRERIRNGWTVERALTQPLRIA